MRRICAPLQGAVTYPAQDVSGPQHRTPGIFDGVSLYRGRGCDRCKNSGYAGRLAIIEAMTIHRRAPQVGYRPRE